MSPLKKIKNFRRNFHLLNALADHIINAKKLGLTEEKITSILLQTGWTAKEVKLVFWVARIKKQLLKIQKIIIIEEPRTSQPRAEKEKPHGKIVVKPIFKIFKKEGKKENVSLLTSWIQKIKSYAKIPQIKLKPKEKPHGKIVVKQEKAKEKIHGKIVIKKIAEKKAAEFEKLPGRMRLIDIISLSLSMFKTRRLRTFLTILGMSIGIGTILFLVSLGYGLQNILFQRIATAESLLTLDVIASEKGFITINNESLEKIKKIPNIEEISPSSLINSQVVFDKLRANTSVFAVEASYLRLGGITPITGRVFNDNEKNKILISSALTKLLNLEKSADALDKEVRFNFLMPKNEEEIEIIEHPQLYQIIGVIDDPDNIFVFLPLSSVADLNIQNFSQVKVKVKSEAYLENIRAEIINMGFLVSAVSDILDQATKIFRAIQIILGTFGLIALIVSAIGMFNTMTIALLERTQEIGIMKALGATPRDIWLIFISESIIMGTTGGLSGIAIGLLGAEIFNFGLNILAAAVSAQSINLFQRPVWFIITIAIFSMFIGFLTGVWPAHRASKLKTLEALRYK